MKGGTRRKIILLFGFFIFLAGLLYYSKVPLASSQTVTIVSKLVDSAPIDDPNAAVWTEATPVDVPLSAQLVTTPRIFEANVGSVAVRSLNDGDRISFLLEWSALKATTDFLRHEDFRDAAAVQFAVTAEPQPYFCMGQEDGIVNIWHWKADWEQDLDGLKDIEDAYPNMAADTQKALIGARNDPYPLSPYQGDLQLDSEIYLTGKGAGNIFSDAGLRESAIENLIAGGFGTLTATDVQNIRGKGVYSDGKYRVMFSRKMTTGDGLVQFAVEKLQPIAFAVWSGAAGDRDGMKSVSSWYQVSVEAKKVEKISPLVYLVALLAILIIAAGGYYYLRRVKKLETKKTEGRWLRWL